ncbi:MAG: ATP-binding cassette domain-containing protein [Gemmatimonadaceae bacterium]
MREEPALAFEHVAKEYRAGIAGCMARARVLEDVSFRVAPGEVVVIGGAPGSGTSTILLLAAGLLRADAGRVWWGGGWGAARLVHPVSTRTLAAAAGDLLRGPPRLLLVERCGRAELVPRVESLVRAAVWRGCGVLMAAAGRPATATATSSLGRPLELRGGRLVPVDPRDPTGPGRGARGREGRAPEGDGARRVAERG